MTDSFLLTRKGRALVRKLARRGAFATLRGQTARIDRVINGRAGLLAAVEPHLERGTVGIVRSGMDCDCVQYQHGRVIKWRGVVAFDRAQDDHAQGLDGPESYWFCHPMDAASMGRRSRDRVLEAYEDGHPHSVSWGSLDD